MNTPTLDGARVVIAGGSGFLGRSLAAHLSGIGAEVVVLSRRADPRFEHARVAPWDGRTVGGWAEEFDGAAALVNLAGRSVDCVKTPDRRDEILRSRVESTRALGEAAQAATTPPPVWVQMSTAHIYGDPPTERCDESSATGHGLAPDVGRAWEATYEEAKPPGARGVVLRTSFVIGRGGGALPRLRTLARFGLGGTVGRGRQGMSWIHERDMNRLFARAITEDSMSGMYVVSAPNPVPNREFMRELRRAMKMPIGLPAPASLVRLGAPLVMRTDPELALYGRYVVPTRLLDESFAFEFPDLGPALDDLLK